MSGWTKIKWDDAMLAAAKRALTKIGIGLERQAVAITPTRHGRLRGSITFATREIQSKVRPARPASGYEAINPMESDAVSTPGDDYTLHVGTNVEYAPYVEYGTVHTSPQSFLKRSLDIHRVQIDVTYAQEISKELQRRAQ